MDEATFKSADEAARRLGMPRNAYINKAVRFFNRLNRRKLLAQELARDSKLVDQESAKVLREFESLGDELK